MSRGSCRQCNQDVALEADVCPHCGVDWPGDRFIGRVIRGDVAIQSRIGAGGMGVVYRGVKQNLDREVAVKILHGHVALNERTVAYFMREARLMSKLRHPNLVSVFDFGREDDGTLIMVMEYIPGRSLDQVIADEAPLSPERALRIMIQIMGALEEVHRQGIIHRDLKPDNVIIESVIGQEDFVKVLDFGIAKIRSGEGVQSLAKTLTTAGAMVGTPYYMSPEQAQGSDATEKSDLYSAGVVLFELLTGEIPFDADNVVAILARRLTEEPPAPSEYVETVPEILDHICLRAMARAPEDRFESANAMRAILEQTIAELGTGASSSGIFSAMGPNTRKPLSRPLYAADTLAAQSNLSGFGTAAPEAAVLAVDVRVRTPEGASAWMPEEELEEVWTFAHQFISTSGGVIKAPEDSGFLAIFALAESETKREALRRLAEIALRLRSALRQRFPDVRAQMGIDYGQIYAHSGADPFADGEVPIGSPIRRAARRATQAPKRQIALSSTLAEQIGAHFELQPHQNDQLVRSLVGHEAPLWADSSQLPLETHDKDVNDALVVVGDPDVPDRIEAVIQATARGDLGGALALVGDDGFGKSHMLRLARRKADAAGLDYILVQCSEERLDRPYRLLLDLLLESIALIERPAHEAMGGDYVLPSTPAELERGLQALGVPDDIAAEAAEQFGAGTEDDPWMLLTLGEERGLSYGQMRRALQLYTATDRARSILRALRCTLEALARQDPVTLLIDDLDLGDEASLLTLEALVQLTRTLPVSLIATSGPLFGSQLEHDGFELLELAPLDEDNCEALWEMNQTDLFSPDLGLPLSVREAAQGCPLYIARWAHTQLDGRPPAGLLELVVEQLAATPGHIRRTLLIASILGYTFEVAVIKGLFPQSEALVQALNGALDTGMLELDPTDARWWRFANPIIQQAVYRSMSRETRMRYHATVFEKLIQLQANRKRNSRLVLQALQASNGELAEEAWTRAEQLGDRFAIAGGLGGAEQWYGIALEMADLQASQGVPLSKPHKLAVAELGLKATEVALRNGHLEIATAFLKAVQPRARDQQIRALTLRARLALAHNNPREAMRSLEPLFKDARFRHPLLLGAMALRGAALLQARQIPKALRAFSETITKLEEYDGDLPIELEYLPWWLAIQCADLLTQDDQLDATGELLKIALQQTRERGDCLGVVRLLQAIARWCVRRRAPQHLARACYDVLGDTGLALRAAQRVVILQLLGVALRASKRPDSARDALTHALRIAEQMQWDDMVQKSTKYLEALDAQAVRA